MGRKKKKKVMDKLARKRGQRAAQSRLKHKKPPKTGKKRRKLTDEERVAVEGALQRSPILLSAPEFVGVHFDREKLTGYLEDVKAREPEDPEEFLSRGIERVADEEFVSEVKMRLARHIQENEEDDTFSSYCARVVLFFTGALKELAKIPFFAAIFVRDVKDHPLSDNPIIWKLLSTYLPSRIVKPEEEREPSDEEKKVKRSEKFPHLVLPKSYSEE